METISPEILTHLIDQRIADEYEETERDTYFALDVEWEGLTAEVEGEYFLALNWNYVDGRKESYENAIFYSAHVDIYKGEKKVDSLNVIHHN